MIFSYKLTFYLKFKVLINIILFDSASQCKLLGKGSFKIENFETGTKISLNLIFNQESAFGTYTVKE